MQAIMISVRPKNNKNILSLVKTLELRKTIPKIKPPFKCYIYCTQLSTWNPSLFLEYESKDGNIYVGGKKYAQFRTARVVAEFICDKIYEFGTEFWPDDYNVYNAIYHIERDDSDDEKQILETSNESDNPDDCWLCKNSCVSFEDIKRYVGTIKPDGEPKEHILYAWHISDLKIYDKPKELSDFYNRCYSGCDNCEYKSWDYAYGGDCKELICTVSNKKPLSRPPQSWCYVEETQGENNI